MHLYNDIVYIFPFSSITRKHNVQIKFHNDGVTKVVTPHSYKLNFLIPHLYLSFSYKRLLNVQSIYLPIYQLVLLNNIYTNIIIYDHTVLEKKFTLPSVQLFPMIDCSSSINHPVYKKHRPGVFYD